MAIWGQACTHWAFALRGRHHPSQDPVWANAVGGLGYLFGHGLELILAHIKHYEIAAFLLIAVAGMALWLIRVIVNRLKGNTTRPGG